MEQKSSVQREVVCPGAAFFKYLALKCKQQIALAFIPDPHHAEGGEPQFSPKTQPKPTGKHRLGLEDPSESPRIKLVT